MIVIDNKYEMKQIVYLKTDPDQFRRVIVGIRVCAEGAILYQLCCGPAESWHYDFEISDGQDVLIKTLE